MNAPFDVPLVADPSVALPPIRIDVANRPGPLYTVQLVIELVGQRTVPATAAAGLLQPDWRSALGPPEVWTMAPADNEWKSLNQTAQSYDSIALAWDFVSPKGRLNSGSAAHLFSVAERFAQAIERRAMPIPPPQDVDARVVALLEAQEALDIGFSLAVASASGWMAEKDIWVQCARLGLNLDSDGIFGWKPDNWEEPIVSVTPLGEAEGFNLGAVQRGEAHPGIGVGFNVPRCPAPEDALAGCLHIARTFAFAFGALILDEDGEALAPATEAAYRRNIVEAENSLKQAGLAPGTAEALKLFA